MTGTDSRLRTRYERFALLALTLDEEGLCRLLASPLVSRVDADVADRPGRIR